MRCTFNKGNEEKIEKMLSGFASFDEKEQGYILGILEGLLYAKMKADGEKMICNAGSYAKNNQKQYKNRES